MLTIKISELEKPAEPTSGQQQILPSLWQEVKQVLDVYQQTRKELRKNDSYDHYQHAITQLRKEIYKVAKVGIFNACYVP